MEGRVDDLVAGDAPGGIGEAGDTHQRQIGGQQHRTAGAARSGGEQAVDVGGQGVDFGYAVHAGAGLCAQAVVEQGQTRGVGGDRAQCDADGLVVGHRGVLRCSIGRCAIGFSQDAVEGIDHGLHFGRGVGQRAGDGAAGQSTLDGGQVAAVHAGHASLCKGGGGRCG